MSKIILYKQNSQFIKVSGLKDQSVNPAVYEDAFPLSATLFDAAGVAVPGATSMVGVYQAGSTGEYRFPVDPAVFNPNTGGYSLVIDGTSGSKRYHVVKAVTVSIRKEGTEV